MDVSFEGIGQWCATFLGEGLQEGQTVKVSGSGTVAACGDGEVFCGVVRAGRGSAYSVQLGGLAKVKYSGSAPAAGMAALAGDGAGGVKTVTTGGRSVLVVDVDTDGSTVTIKL